MKVLIDSNFAIDIFKFKLGFEVLKDIEAEIGKFEIIALKQVLDELKNVSKTRKKEANFAKIAISWLENNAKKIEIKAKNADEAILNFSDKDTIVATNDKELRKKLKSKGIKSIYLRAKKYLKIG